MGFFDEFDNPSAELFDYNSDGKLDDYEKDSLRYYEFEQLQKLMSKPKPAKDDDWQEFCEDGSKYGLDPFLFEDEEDYEIALESAKLQGFSEDDDKEDYSYDLNNDEEDYDLNDDVVYYDTYSSEKTADTSQCITLADVFKIEWPEMAVDKIKREEYPNRRMYDAAYTLAEYKDNPHRYDSKIEKRCNFILNNQDILAARYLTFDGDFLYVQAIKENFDLPVLFSDDHDNEDLIPTSLSDAIEKLIEKDIYLSLQVWEWCIDRFLPYIEYDWVDGREYLFDDVLDKFIYNKKAVVALIEYCQDNSNFWHKLFENTSNLNSTFSSIGYECIDSCDNFDLLKDMYGYCVDVFYYNSDELSDAIDDMYQICTEGDNVVYIKRYFEEILPLTDHITDERITNTLKKYRNEVVEYIREEESFNEEETEETFFEGKNAYMFDLTESYTYCGVIFENSSIIYHYRTENETIEIGDDVVVSVGKNNVERTARVVSIGQYSKFAAPYPPDKAKFVKRKAE